MVKTQFKHMRMDKARTRWRQELKGETFLLNKPLGLFDMVFHDMETPKGLKVKTLKKQKQKIILSIPFKNTVIQMVINSHKSKLITYLSPVLFFFPEIGLEEECFCGALFWMYS